MGFISRFFKLSYEERVKIVVPLTIVFSLLVCIAKFVFAYFFGAIFLIAGLINVFMFLSKVTSFKGITKPSQKFKTRNLLVSLFIISTGVLYTVYSSRLIFGFPLEMEYPLPIAILITITSVIEMILAAYGLFRVKRKGHFFRNLKITNFTHAITSIVLAQIAIMSFAYSGPNRMYINGMTGIIGGIIILLLGIYIFFAPLLSIIDRDHNIFVLEEKELNTFNTENGSIYIELSKSKIYGDYFFIGTVSNDVVDGHIIRGRGFWSELHPVLKVLCLMFSFILIFVYMFLGFFYFLKTANMPQKLINKMNSNGYRRIITYDDIE